MQSLNHPTLSTSDPSPYVPVMGQGRAAGGTLPDSNPLPRGRFDATLADETRALPFAGEGVWAGRFDDLDELTKAKVEGGEGQRARNDAFTSAAQKVLDSKIGPDAPIKVSETRLY